MLFDFLSVSDIGVTKGIFAEVSDRSSLEFGCLDFGKKFAKTLNGQNVLQVNLSLELLKSKVKLRTLVSPLSAAILFLAAAPAEIIDNCFAKVAQSEGFAVFETVSEVFLPVV